MKKSKFTEEQIAFALRQAETGAVSAGVRSFRAIVILFSKQFLDSADTKPDTGQRKQF
ncbi:MAG: hypothetical protein NTW38_00180 [Candidatus Aminicenantes bacterium]|nr:hypothetical protein [Candidatus Aminicenantes bacterium]